MCVLDPSYKNGCEINEPDQAQYCAPDPGPCDRSTNFTNSFENQENYYTDTREEDQRKTNSLVFNTFIWLQVRAVTATSASISVGRLCELCRCAAALSWESSEL